MTGWALAYMIRSAYSEKQFWTRMLYARRNEPWEDNSYTRGSYNSSRYLWDQLMLFSGLGEYFTNGNGD